ncbi:MAG: hypothetical protein M9894_15875 [Planctomycetes bacterium]|nr:hypothetical protein [Planctomycetota bacterium]
MRTAPFIGGVLIAGLVVTGCSQGSRPGAAGVAGPDVTGAWGAALLQGREGHQVSVLADGRALVTGGRTSAGVTAACEWIDVTARRVQPGPEATQPRADHAAVAHAGAVYLLGGRDASGPLDTVEVLRDGRFERLAERLSAPRAGAAAALVGELLVVAGGEAATAEVWELEPAPRRRATIALPRPFRDAALVALGERALLVDAGGPPALLTPRTGEVRVLEAPASSGAPAALVAPAGAEALAALVGEREVVLVDAEGRARPGAAVASGAGAAAVSPAAGLLLVAGGADEVGLPRAEVTLVSLGAGTRPAAPLFEARRGVRAASARVDDRATALLVGGVDAAGRPSAVIDAFTFGAAPATDGEDAAPTGASAGASTAGGELAAASASPESSPAPSSAPTSAAPGASVGAPGVTPQDERELLRRARADLAARTIDLRALTLPVELELPPEAPAPLHALLGEVRAAQAAAGADGLTGALERGRRAEQLQAAGDEWLRRARGNGRAVAAPQEAAPADARAAAFPLFVDLPRGDAPRGHDVALLRAWQAVQDDLDRQLGDLRGRFAAGEPPARLAREASTLHRATQELMEAVVALVDQRLAELDAAR